MDETEDDDIPNIDNTHQIKRHILKKTNSKVTPHKKNQVKRKQDHSRPIRTARKKQIDHKCEICGKDFTVKGDMKKHILFVHEGIKYPCSECPREFPTPSKQKRHFEQVHLGKLIPFLNPP